MTVHTPVPALPRAVLRGRELFDPAAPGRIGYEWSEGVIGDLRGILAEPSAFPCTFARRAFKANQLHYLFAGSPFDAAERARVRQGLIEYLDYMDGLTGIEESMNALVIAFEPDSSPLPAEAYHQRAWMVMQDWIDNDPSPWPGDVPSDPHAAFWSLCFRGVPLFVNVSNPAHETRRSRNLGRSLVLVTQPRAGFDRVADDTPEGDKIRNHIRALMAAYDGIPAPEELGTYHRGDLEWVQYALLETNAERQDRCPLRMRAGREA